MNFAEIQNGLNALYQSDWFKYLALPVIAAVYKGITYIMKRKIERKPETEHIAHLHQLADLQAKLEKSGTTLADLQSFGAEALGRSAGIALVTAQHYTNAASQLIGDAEKANKDADWDHALTQMEMNDVAGRKAWKADEELADILSSHLPNLSEEERILLQAAQTSWGAFRDSEVKRESKKWEGGSIRPMMELLRHEALTRERIASLQAEFAEANAR